MENLICSAYAFIEFKGDFKKYCKDSFNRMDSLTKNEMLEHWQQVVRDYQTVSECMSDKAIKQAQQLVLNCF